MAAKKKNAPVVKKVAEAPAVPAKAEKMNERDFRDALFQRITNGEGLTYTKVPRNFIDKVANEAKEVALEALREGKQLSFFGLGVLAPVSKPERQARNPKTGETIVVPAKETFKFKPSKAAVDLLVKDEE